MRLYVVTYRESGGKARAVRVRAEPEPLLATIENMREHYAPGVLAYSPFTGEEYSADPGDYFWLPEGESLTDSQGEPMVLVTRRTTFVPVSAP